MVGVWDESLWSRRPCTCVLEIFLCSLSLHQAVSRSQLFHFSQILLYLCLLISPLSLCIHEYMCVCVCCHVLLALFSFRWKIIKTYITNTCTHWGCKDEVILRCRDSCSCSFQGHHVPIFLFEGTIVSVLAYLVP